MDLGISHYMPVTHGTHRDFIEPWALELEQRSRGEIRVYVSPVYFVMNRGRYEALPASVREAVDAISGDALVARFRAGWGAWEAPARAVVAREGNTITTLGAEERSRWQAAIRPMVETWLAELDQAGVPEARALYEAALRRAAEAAGRAG